ncbi:MAG: hypothetical protein RLN72_16615 [Henriciella sp.]
MNARLAMRMGRATLGLAGAGALSACSQGAPGSATDALAECYLTIQKAMVSVQLAQSETTITDRVFANQKLNEATRTVIAAWARREGVALTEQDLIDETETATTFLNGIDAEAGLSGQALASEMTEASDHPELWQAKYNKALDCAGQAAS